MKNLRLHIVLFYLLLAVLIIVLVSLLLLRIPAVQSYAGKQVTKYIAAQLDTRIEIEDIDIDIYDRIHLKGVYIEDHQQDTLLTADELYIKVSALSLWNKKLAAQDIRLKNAVINLYALTPDENNFDFLLDQFARPGDQEPSTENSTTAPWDLDFGDLDVTSTRVAYKNKFTGEQIDIQLGTLALDAQTTDIPNSYLEVSSLDIDALDIEVKRGFDDSESDDASFLDDFKIGNIGWEVLLDQWNITNSRFSLMEDAELQESSPKVNFRNLDLSEITMHSRDVKLIGDSILLALETLSFEDHSGFRVSEMKTDLAITSKKITADNFLLRTANSEVSDRIELKYKDFSAFHEFEDELYITAELKKSSLRLDDLGYFLPPDAMERIAAIVETDGDIYLTGDFKGRISNFKGSNLHIWTGDDTAYKGSLKLRGLPDFQNSFIDLRINELRTTAEDVQSLLIDFEIPENFARLGKISFKGNFTGFPRDFVADGTLISDLGTITSDVNMKAKGSVPMYSGDLSMDNFELGEFLDRDDMGKISLTTSLRGRGFDMESLYADIDGKVDKFEFRDHEYSEITLDGRFDRKLFSGLVDINDENLQMNFTGTVDLNAEKPVYSFETDIEDANLKNLNIVKDDLIVSAQAQLGLSGTNIDDIKGDASFHNITITRNGRTQAIDEVELFSAIDARNQRQLELSSELFNASFTGDYNFKELANAFQEFVNHYFPLEFQEVADAQEQDIHFDIEVHKAIEFADLFVPKLTYISPGRIRGDFNNTQRAFNIDLSLDSLVFDRFRADTIALRASSGQQKIHIESALAALNFDDQVTLDDISMIGDLSDYKFVFELVAAENDPENGITMQGIAESDFKKINLRLDKLEVLTKGLVWNGSLGEAEFISKSDFFIDDFALLHEEQSVRINSAEGSSNSGPINIEMNNFQLDKFLALANKEHLKIKGTTNGLIDLTDPFLNPVLTGDIEVEGFEFLGKMVGDVNLDAHKNPGKNEIGIEGSINGPGNQATLRGNYFITHDAHKMVRGKHSNVELDVLIERLNIELLEAFMGNIISETEGTASGNAHLYGDIRQPSINGAVVVSNASAVVDYLQNRLRVSKQQITFDDKKILFDDFEVMDRFDNIAMANGYVNLNDYKKPSIDLAIASDHFLFLETTRKDNGLYYGTALGEGSASFRGPMTDLKMEIDAKSHEGTDISMLLEDEDVVSQSQHDFTFIVKERDKVEMEADEEVVAARDLAIDIDLEVTPDAELKLIFDEQAGDIIRSTGTGNISMNYHSRGDMDVFGTYTIEEGDYLFTMQDVINKPFKVKKGGSVAFYGDPYTAQIDIDAYYSLRTSVSELVSSTLVDASELRKRVPIDVIMDLTGTLSAPDINFQLDMPDASILGGSAGAQAQRILDGINNDIDDNELNRQVFGLLVFKRFLPAASSDPVLDLAVAGGKSTATEFLSAQFTSFLNETLSQLIPNSDFDFNWSSYEEGDLGTQLSRNEVEMVYKQRLFNDRISIGIGGRVGDDISADINNPETSNLYVASDFVFQYLITPEGQLRLKVYGKSDVDVFSGRFNKNGIALFFNEEFDELKDFKESRQARRLQREMRRIIKEKQREERLAQQNG